MDPLIQWKGRRTSFPEFFSVSTRKDDSWRGLDTLPWRQVWSSSWGIISSWRSRPPIVLTYSNRYFRPYLRASQEYLLKDAHYALGKSNWPKSQTLTNCIILRFFRDRTHSPREERPGGKSTTPEGMLRTSASRRHSQIRNSQNLGQHVPFINKKRSSEKLQGDINDFFIFVHYSQVLPFL